MVSTFIQSATNQKILQTTYLILDSDSMRSHIDFNKRGMSGGYKSIEIANAGIMRF